MSWLTFDSMSVGKEERVMMAVITGDWERRRCWRWKVSERRTRGFERSGEGEEEFLFTFSGEGEEEFLFTFSGGGGGGVGEKDMVAILYEGSGLWCGG